MDLSEHPPLKKRRTQEDVCIICNNRLDVKADRRNIVLQPKRDGLQTLLNASEKRKDSVYDVIFPMREDILSGVTKIAFHKNCRASYTSLQNLNFVKNESPQSSTFAASVEAEGSRRLNRAATLTFDIKRDCFVCGKVYKRGQKLTPVSTGTGQSTRQHMLSAAEQRQDHQMRGRMLFFTELFANDAKYHRTCYTHYISQRNIKAAVNQATKATHDITDEISQSACNKALQLLCDEMCSTVFSKKKSVVFLSELHSRFTEILREKSESEQCRITSWRLKEKLKQNFEDQIVFIPQSGKSDLVCSKDVTIGDALKKVNKLHMGISEQGKFEALSVPEDSDSQVFSGAAGIIRKAIAGLSFQENEYAPSSEIEIRKCKEFVPDVLLDFVGWCTSKRFFESALGCSEIEVESRDLLKMLAVCHNIIALSCSIATPMSFGLGVQMHHDFGSKQLLDILSSIGYSVSYDEVRRFLTSVAKDELSSSEVYVPRGVRSFDGSDLATIVDSAIDNFDQNEDTLDGKSSTHSMAIVLYQRTAVPEDIKGIPRTSSKALDVSEFEEPSLKRYQKPHSRPEPRGLDSSSALEVKKGDTYMRSVSTDLFWHLTRMVMGEACSVLAWSGFNSVLCETNLPVATIRYLPFIHAPPSEFSTVFTTLLKLVAIADRLGNHTFL